MIGSFSAAVYRRLNTESPRVSWRTNGNIARLETVPARHIASSPMTGLTAWFLIAFSGRLECNQCFAEEFRTFAKGVPSFPCHTSLLRQSLRSGGKHILPSFLP